MKIVLLTSLVRYIANPLTINGHKFHLRVYVLCVGALRVYVNQRILMLVAAHRYSTEDLADSLAHLSNTARGIEDEDFDEEKFVLVSHSFAQSFFCFPLFLLLIILFVYLVVC